MRIAQISPIWERVPPLRYGGIELVIQLLTDELVRRGHEVTLFASGDSITSANLKPFHERGVRLDPNIKEPGVYEHILLADVYQQAHNFDIIHSHVGYPALSYAGFVKTPTVHTLHGVFNSDNEKIYRHFAWQNFISISESQREPRLGLNYIHTAYNGIDTSIYHFQAEPEQPGYLAFVGRMSPEKGPLEAIKIAEATGMPLRMAGKIDTVDQEFWQQKIAPLVDGDRVKYLGEVSHTEKVALLGGATATLFPISWREPFGLVMIESMATGTPVIAIGLGAVPEVVAHEKTGFICHSLENMIDAVTKAVNINRQTCREYVKNRFSIKSMTDEYEKAYHMILRS
jgi:glycosyltransferase involved in cell wall biosynthesis